VTLSQLEKCISITNSCQLLLKCNDVRYKEHDGLLPFFYDNFVLSYLYDSILTSDNEEERKAEITSYKTKLSRVCLSKQHRQTCFHSQSGPYTNSFDLEENEWTVRFYYSLQPYLHQGISLNCTFNKGPMFTCYQFEYSHQVSSWMYYFHGAPWPDIIVTKNERPIDLL